MCTLSSAVTYRLDAQNKLKYDILITSEHCAEHAPVNLLQVNGGWLYQAPATFANNTDYDITDCGAALFDIADYDETVDEDKCFPLVDGVVVPKLGADESCAAYGGAVCVVDETVCAAPMTCAPHEKTHTCQYPFPDGADLNIQSVVVKLNVTASDYAGKTLFQSFWSEFEKDTNCSYTHHYISPANMANSKVRLYFHGLNRDTCTPEAINKHITAAQSSYVPAHAEDDSDSEFSKDDYPLLEFEKFETPFKTPAAKCFDTQNNALSCMAVSRDCKIKCAADVKCGADIECGSSDCHHQTRVIDGKTVKARWCTSAGVSASVVVAVVLAIASAVAFFF